MILIEVTDDPHAREAQSFTFFRKIRIINGLKNISASARSPAMNLPSSLSKSFFAVTLLLTFIIAVPARAQVKGPILELIPESLDFDTTFCGTAKCLDVVFRNIGDTTLTVRSFDDIPLPFSGSIAVPFSIVPGASRSVSICYRPTLAPAIDTLTLNFRADTRLPLSIALLFDVSNSMNQEDVYDPDAGSNVSRISAAHDAGVDFIGGLLATTDITDEAAVVRFAATSDYSVLQFFTSNKAALTSAVPASAFGNYTCLYNALVKVVNLLAARSNQRVIIALTDGADNCSGSAETISDVITAATGARVRIFTVGIGNAEETPLTQIANSTGGQYFTASTRRDLIAVYRTIATLLSQNVDMTLPLRGRAVSPSLDLNVNVIDFDSVRVGNTVCLPVVIRNTGDAPMRISSSGIEPPFSFESTFPTEEIFPGNTRTVNICFTPTRLRQQALDITIDGNGCMNTTELLRLMGVGWDSVTVSLTDSVRARPGSVVTFSVRLLDAVPSGYEVSSLSVVLAYNKTLLYPFSSALETSGLLAEPMTNSSFFTTFGPDEAEFTFQLSGGTLTTDGSTTDEIARVAFTVLHGNSRTTPVRLVDVVFADGNPRVGRIDPGFLLTDSLCYQDERLIDASARFGEEVVGNHPNPFSVSTRLVYRVEAEGRVKLEVLDAMGRRVKVLVDEYTEPGSFSVDLDGATLSPGVYVIRLITPGGTTVHKIVRAK